MAKSKKADAAAGRLLDALLKTFSVQVDKRISHSEKLDAVGKAMAERKATEESEMVSVEIDRPMGESVWLAELKEATKIIPGTRVSKSIKKPPAGVTIGARVTSLINAVEELPEVEREHFDWLYCEMSPHVRQLEFLLRKVMKSHEKKVKGKGGRQRNRENDKKIVAWHDNEKLSFGKIAWNWWGKPGVVWDKKTKLKMYKRAQSRYGKAKEAEEKNRKKVTIKV